MDIRNLAQPFWLAVNCSAKILPDVFCQYHADITASNDIVSPNKNICRNCGIVKNNTCFIFQTQNVLPLKDTERLCRRKQNSLSPVTSIKKFQYLFEAVIDIFPPLYVCGANILFTYGKYQHFFLYKSNPPGSFNSSFILQISSHKLRDYHPGGNVFICGELGFMSYLYFIDRWTVSEHVEKLSICQTDNNLNDSRFWNCSRLHYRSHSGKCIVFVLTNFKTSVPTGEKLSQQEYDSIQEMKHRVALSNQLKCAKDVYMYFNVSEICSYRLDKSGKVTPCSKGEHLQNCRQFECNALFKCPGHYCVPMGYLCDGRWHCPYGRDESIQCGPSRKCVHLFKCKGTQKCVHLSEICNGIMECPAKDDEQLCSLSRKRCPSQCQCLAFAISCSDVQLPYKQKLHPYFSITLQHVVQNFHSDPHLAYELRFAALLEWTSSSLSDVCCFFLFNNSLIYINLGQNKITLVGEKCFSFSLKLKVIQLNNNLISRLDIGAFTFLQNLVLLNLSTNLLTEISSQMVSGCPKLKLLSLQNNSFSTIMSDNLKRINFQVLETENFRLCCVLESDVRCTATIPWIISCSNLLPNLAIELMCYIVSSMITCTSLICCLLMKRNLSGTGTKKSFTSIAISLNLSDVLCAVNISFIWIADLNYVGKIILMEHVWRRSVGCFILFHDLLLFSMLNPFLLCFLSLSRLMVVVFPIQSRFKKYHFVIKFLTGVSMSLIVVCSGITLTSSFEVGDAGLPTKMCSPVSDPTGKCLSVKTSTFVIVVIQAVASFFVVTCYILLVHEKKASQQKLNLKQSNTFLVIQILITTGSNLLCWIPGTTVYLAAMFLSQYPTVMFVWMSVAVTPINSVIHPMLFLFVTARKRLK